jgi:hypothetical protein
LRPGQRKVYGHRRGTSLVSGLFSAKPYIHQVVPLFDPKSMQAI